MDRRTETIDLAFSSVRSKIGDFSPVAGIILGSGLGLLAEKIQDPVVVPYKDIAGFPVSTAIGHKGNLIAGYLGGKPVLAMQGRFHYYEGYPMDLVTLPVRVMARLGVRYLFVSNAAGGANPDFNVGDLMVIKDHINLLPNPLVGPNLADFGERFPDMTCAYDRGLAALADSIAAELGIGLRHGVYLAGTGPSYETPAECRYMRLIGADAIGMSTIPEVIVARHCGIAVFGMSCITNKSNFDNSVTVLNDGDDVILQAGLAAERMSALFARMIESLPDAPAD